MQFGGEVLKSIEIILTVLGGAVILVGPMVTAYVGLVKAQAKGEGRTSVQWQEVTKDLSRIEGKIDTINGTVRRHDRDLSVAKHRLGKVERKIASLTGEDIEDD